MVKQLLNELIAAGYNQRRISAESGVDASLVSRLLAEKRGSRPTYETVRAIEVLHAQVCRSRPTRRPKRQKAA